MNLNFFHLHFKKKKLLHFHENKLKCMLYLPISHVVQIFVVHPVYVSDLTASNVTFCLTVRACTYCQTITISMSIFSFSKV